MFFGDPEVLSLDPEIVVGPGVNKNLEVYLLQALKKFVQDPETAWGPESS